AIAFSTASDPAFSAAGLGGYHSGYQWLIAMPQKAMAQPGSVLATAVNCFSASGYQNECKVHTACLNSCCTAGLQDVAKSTFSTIFAPVSARAPGCTGNASSAAA